MRDRRQRARPPDAGRDLAHDRHGLLRRILVRERPARRLGRRAELLLEPTVVHLDDDAVGLEVEARGASRPMSSRNARDLLEGGAAPPVRVDGKSPGPEGARGSRSATPEHPRRLGDRVEPRSEPAAGGHARVEQPQRARRRRCADWRTAAPPRPPARRSSLANAVLRVVDLAAHLDRARLLGSAAASRGSSGRSRSRPRRAFRRRGWRRARGPRPRSAATPRGRRSSAPRRRPSGSRPPSARATRARHASASSQE